VLLALLTFLLTASICLALLLLFMRRGRNRDGEVASPRGRRPLIFGGLTAALAGIWPVRPGIRERYSRWLRQAGHYHAQAVIEFLALRNALVVGTLLVVVAAVVVVTQPGDAAMYTIGLGGLILIIVLFSLPPLVLESMAAGRKRRIEESLPDAMDMITMCTSAGLPLQHAIVRVSDELQSTHPDLSYELRIVGRHTEAGSLTSAMQQFAKRMDAPEIHSLAAMVWQAEQQGASVAGAFHTFADQVRMNRRQRAEEAGNKAAFKMLFPLVFCLAPAVYLMLLGPAALELRDFFRREKQPGGALSASPEGIRSAQANTATAPMGPAGTAPAGAPAAGPAGTPGATPPAGPPAPPARTGPLVPVPAG
jgi:tight adherence protein C